MDSLLPTSRKNRIERLVSLWYCAVSHSYGALSDPSFGRQNAPLCDQTFPKRSGRLNARYADASPPALEPVMIVRAGSCVTRHFPHNLRACTPTRVSLDQMPCSAP